MSKINNLVINYLKTLGYKVIDTSMYDKIKVWNNYWTDELEWHSYYDQTGKKRRMHSLGMAKRIAEDWASIEFSERDNIKSSNEKNQKYLDETLPQLHFFDDLPEDIERASALGTSGAIFRVKNAEVRNDVVIAGNNTKLDLIRVSADQIIPLRVEHGNIIDVAFASEDKIGDKEVYYIEIHELKYDSKLDKEIYWIKNKYIDSKTGEELKKEGVAEEYTLNTDIPIFSILKTPLVNPTRNDNGLGLSMYANALDQINACDITYHNFVMDFFLGGKKMFYNKKIVKTETIMVEQSDGTKKPEEIQIYPDDIARQQWATYGDEMQNINDDPAVIEYNPDLRIEANKAGVQFALDLTSFKCSLGTKRYQFNGTTVVTATQYNGDNQDLVRNANKFRKKLDSYIKNICRGLLLFGRILFNENVTEDDEIKLEDIDGFLVDTESKYSEMRQEVSMGYRSKKSYLMNRYKLSEEEATKILKEVEDENSSSYMVEGE